MIWCNHLYKIIPLTSLILVDCRAYVCIFGSDCGLRDQLAVEVTELKLTTRKPYAQLKFTGPGI